MLCREQRVGENRECGVSLGSLRSFQGNQSFFKKEVPGAQNAISQRRALRLVETAMPIFPDADRRDRRATRHVLWLLHGVNLKMIGKLDSMWQVADGEFQVALKNFGKNNR